MIFGSATQRPTHFLKTGLAQARRVGRVDTYDGRPVGSGFLVDGSIFGQAFDGLPIFVTAGHVIGTSNLAALPFSEATVVFEGMFDDASPRITAKCHQVLIESPLDKLNYILLLLDRWPGTVADLLLAPERPEPFHEVFVVSYPAGRGLAIAFKDNEVVAQPSSKLGGLRFGPDRVYCRAPTEGGSSGGPVFNENWEIVGIHNGGLKEIGCNWGVAIDAVVLDARSRLESDSISSDLAASIRATAGQIPRAESDPKYFSVFISYSHADSVFANRLYNALQSRGIRAWLDAKQMRPGDDIYEEVQKGIQLRDKVLLCASEASLTSWWVDSEIERIFQKERDLFKKRKGKVLALIPLMLDDFMLSRWESGKAPEVKSRLAADFRDWEDQTKFEGSFDSLVNALDLRAREIAPESKL
jgi:TIR domain/Trypsin-like peptidase domain